MITHLKSLAKEQEKSKKECLKAKDVKIKESNMVLQKNLKGCKKLTTMIEDLHMKIGVQASMISNLNGDIMSKIRECEMLKKENKTLSLQGMPLDRKGAEVDKRKMEVLVNYIFLIQKIPFQMIWKHVHCSTV
jgi:hypothetical protein